MHNCKHATLIHIYNNVCALPSWSCLGCETNKIAKFPLLTADLARVFSNHNANILHIECTMQIVLIPELRTRQYTAAFACDKTTAPGSVFLRSKTQHLSVNAASVIIVSPTMGGSTPPIGSILINFLPPSLSPSLPPSFYSALIIAHTKRTHHFAPLAGG
jgi:hypothetical protein